MKTRAVRLYDANDLRLDVVQLPEIKEDEILAKIITDSVCMSTYKGVIQGSKHKRIPIDIAQHPIVIGHEFAGEIIQVGKAWKDSYTAGQRFSIQPNINYLNKGYAPGYSFEYFGGDAQYIIIPSIVMEKSFLLPYSGKAYYKASLAEPMSCIIAAFQAQYHLDAQTKQPVMGTVAGGNMAICAGVGPMGLGAIDYAIHGPNPPKRLVVTDIDAARLERARALLSVENALLSNVELHYVNTSKLDDPAQYLLDITEGAGFDDVFVFAPVAPVVELADSILGKDGCLNFFAGPTDKQFSARMNFYNVHYLGTHVVGTSGGDTADMQKALDLMADNQIDPSVMITHIGGLDSAVQTTLDLPNIPGGKKLIYTHLELGLTSLEEIVLNKDKNSLFATLAPCIEKNQGLWSEEAEDILLQWIEDNHE